MLNLIKIDSLWACRDVGGHGRCEDIYIYIYTVLYACGSLSVFVAGHNRYNDRFTSHAMVDARLLAEL